MTDPIDERDPKLPPVDEGEELELDDAFADPDENGDDEADAEADDDENHADDDENDEDDDAEYEAGTAGAAGAAVAARGDSAISDGRGNRPGNRLGDRQPAKSGLSPSEIAVHVSDRASAVFVVAVVAVFIAIFAYGLVGGVGGFLTPLPTLAPLASPSPSPVVSASPSS